MKKEKVKTRRHVDPAELRELGFAEGLIEEAILRERRGLLAMEPPPDLVERTIQACADLFRPETNEEAVEENGFLQVEPSSYFSTVFHLLPVVRDLSLAFRAAATVAQCQKLGEWAARFAADSMHFALSERRRPLIALESHMLTSPSWWDENPEFEEMKAAFHTLNEFVSSTGIERSARIIVLRPNISEYDQHEIRAIEALTREGSSDLWWVTFANAAKYSQESFVVIIGNENVLRLRSKSKSAAEALEAMEYSQNEELVSELRQRITNEICPNAIPIKIGGQLEPFVLQALREPQGIRSALKRVIEGRNTEVHSSGRSRGSSAQHA